MEEKTRHEVLKSIYEQHWLHARHVENERLWFTNIYILIVGVLLAYTFGKSETSFWSWSILAIIFILSLAGFFMCHSLRIPFVYHTKMADAIQIKQWDLPYNYGWYDPPKLIHFHAVFSWLYIVMSSFSVSFILHDLAYDWSWYRWWIALVAFLVCVGILYGYFYKFIFEEKEKETRKKLDELLRASASGEKSSS